MAPLRDNHLLSRGFCLGLVIHGPAHSAHTLALCLLGHDGSDGLDSSGRAFLQNTVIAIWLVLGQISWGTLEIKPTDISLKSADFLAHISIDVVVIVVLIRFTRGLISDLWRRNSHLDGVDIVNFTVTDAVVSPRVMSTSEQRCHDHIGTKHLSLP